MSEEKSDEVRQSVRNTYAEIARSGSSGCGCTPDSACCSNELSPSGGVVSTKLGYSEQELTSIPEGANMGLGCGNPQAIAALKSGETVVDLGSGGGFDCFLAARQVGPAGRVIGIDMTPEMVSKARENARKGGYANVEFRLGEIENLPAADASVDAVISNCVINLSPEKERVFKEAFRILKGGGRLAIYDIVATAQMPEKMKNDLALLAGCIAGAAQIDELKSMLKQAGFTDISVRSKEESKELIREWLPGKNIEDFVVSATIEAVKA